MDAHLRQLPKGKRNVKDNAMGAGLATKRIGGHHGGEDSSILKIDNIDDQRGILDNSSHAINRKKK